MKYRKQQKLTAGLLCLAVAAQNAAAMPAFAMAGGETGSLDACIQNAEEMADKGISVLSVGMPVVTVDFGKLKLNYNPGSGKWYSDKAETRGRLVHSETADVQEVVIGGAEHFRFQLKDGIAEEKTEDGTWERTHRLDIMLREIQSYRPEYEKTFYDNASQKMRDVPEIASFPLTFVMTPEAEQPECQVFLEGELLDTIRCTDYEPGGSGGNVHPQHDKEPDVNPSAKIDYFTSSGDISLDGSISISDAVIVNRLVAEDSDIPVTDLGMDLADHDGDGMINMWDVQDLLYMAVGTSASKWYRIRGSEKPVVQQDAVLLYTQEEQDAAASEMFGMTTDALRQQNGNVNSKFTEGEDSVTLEILFFTAHPMAKYAVQGIGADESGELHLTLSVLTGAADAENTAYCGRITLTLPKEIPLSSTNVHLHFDAFDYENEYSHSLPQSLVYASTSTEIWQEPKRMEYETVDPNLLLSRPLDYTVETLRSEEDDIDDLCMRIAQMSKESLFNIYRLEGDGERKEMHQYGVVTNNGNYQRIEILILMTGRTDGVQGILNAVPYEVKLDQNGKATVALTMLTGSRHDSLAAYDVLHVTVDVPYGLLDAEQTPEAVCSRFYDVDDAEDFAKANMPVDLYLNAEAMPDTLRQMIGTSCKQIHAQEVTHYAYEGGMDYFAQQFGYADFDTLRRKVDKTGITPVLAKLDEPMNGTDETLTLGFLRFTEGFDDFAVTGLEYDEIQNKLIVRTASYYDLSARYVGTNTPHTNMTQYICKLTLPEGSLFSGILVEQQNTVFDQCSDPNADVKFREAQSECPMLIQTGRHYRQPDEVPEGAVLLTDTGDTEGFAPEYATQADSGSRVSVYYTFEQGEEEDTLTLYLYDRDGAYNDVLTGLERCQNGRLRLHLLSLYTTGSCIGSYDPCRKMTYTLPHGVLDDVRGMELQTEMTSFRQELLNCEAKQLYIPPYTVSYEEILIYDQTRYNYNKGNISPDFYKAIPLDTTDENGQAVGFDADGKDNFGYLLTEGETEDTLSLFFQLEGGYFVWDLEVSSLAMDTDGILNVGAVRVANTYSLNEGFYRRDLQIPHGFFSDIKGLHVMLHTIDGQNAEEMNYWADGIPVAAVWQKHSASEEQTPFTGDLTPEITEQKHWTYGDSQPFIQDEEDLAELAEIFRCTNDPAEIQAQIEGADGKKTDWITFERSWSDEQDILTVMAYRAGTTQYERLRSLRLDANGILHAVYDSYQGGDIAEHKLDVCKLNVPREIQAKIRGIVREVQPHIVVSEQFERCGIDLLNEIGDVSERRVDAAEVISWEYAEFRGDYNAPDDAFAEAAAMVGRTPDEIREMQYSDYEEERGSFVMWYIQPGVTEDELHLMISIPDGGAYDYKLEALNTAEDAIIPTLYRVPAANPAEGGFVCAMILTVPLDALNPDMVGKGMEPVEYTEHGYYRDPAFDALGDSRFDPLYANAYYKEYIEQLEPAEIVLTVDSGEQNMTYVPLKRCNDSTWEFYEEDYLQGFGDDSTWEKVCAFFGCDTREEAMTHFEGENYAPWIQWRLMEGEEEDTLALLSFDLPDGNDNHELIPLEYTVTADGTLQVYGWDRLNMYRRQPYVHYEELRIQHGSLPEIRDMQWIELVGTTDKANRIAVEQP